MACSGLIVRVCDGATRKTQACSLPGMCPSPALKTRRVCAELLCWQWACVDSELGHQKEKSTLFMHKQAHSLPPIWGSSKLPTEFPACSSLPVAARGITIRHTISLELAWKEWLL